jgi:hypothetical protein
VTEFLSPKNQLSGENEIIHSLIWKIIGGDQKINGLK